MRVFTSFVIILTLSFSTVAKETPLNVYLWEDTLSPRVVDLWQDTHSTPLQRSHFDNDDERSLLMMKNIQLPFDIVVLDNVSANIYGKLGGFENLSKLPNRKHNASMWNQACGDYAVPYFWGTVGITYRKDLVSTPPNTWHDFVNPPQAQWGKIGMINDTVESFLPLFYSLGVSPTTESREEIQQAYPALQEFSQRVLSFEYILSYFRSQSNADEMQLALAYSGDQYSLNRLFGRDAWGFIVPEGQLYLWVDCLAISSHSKNKRAAKAFLNFLSDPKVAAINAMDIKAATPNLSALKQMPDWYRNDASLFPEAERVESGQIDGELSAKNISLRTKILNRIVKNHETQY
ncbi:putative spermidine/putrescine ABC transporter, periplasmic spermidine/putrescine-binding protein [Vibrio sinaloensis DSM 21326]|uniref:Putative spermidine/putrescine ABC transporter, periplasmic spermidine/putrescine-binding protein n=1 Tax=Vibrio sinaloensis DSM 21326 TaxID=945550 RepID=E8M793_PHOS4|nr:spermidine/putrescine ABC transporter substrate-binding protein [Vibrio sinaloensis]EGA70165.1 putative spermidine/putrescine ABC transporter, periplasmic spermidine/putrescine-binding protein [Vibrio sinaloensis DSM 21326]